MAKYGKNNYFDGVVLPEPKEEALRRMAKGVNCSDGGFMSAAAELNVVPCSIQCVFKPMVLTDSPQTVFAMSNSASAPRIDLHNGYITAYLGYNSIRIYDIAVDTVYDFVFVCDSDKSILYVNGNLAASFADVSRCSGYKLGYLLVNSTKYHFQGDYLLHRHFNYAMSANEVKALDNTGDPAGYVVPLADKYRWEASESNIGNIRFYPNYEGSGVTSYLEDNANGFTGRYAHIISGSSGLLSVYSYRFMGHPVGCVVEAKFKYRSNAPVRVLEGNRILPINMEDAADATIVYRTTGTNISGFSITVPNADANSWVEIQPVSLRTLGCIAEYLPHNLIPTAEGSVVKWLDSAPQLPEANGILPPLDASVGGYDLAAIGNPKIII